MMNKTAAAEGEYTKTSIWWDIENCQVPKGCDAYGIAQKLNSELMKMNYCGPLSISSYGNTNLIPDSVQQALSSTGISLNHVPSGRKDASDKKILVDLFLWVLDNPPPANVMLISGDGDFSYALHRLRMLRYNIILAHTQEAPASLVASATTTWLWRSLFAGVSSEYVSFKEPMGSRSNSSKTARYKTNQIYVPKASNPDTERKKIQKNCNKTGESAWFCNVASEDLQQKVVDVGAEMHFGSCCLVKKKKQAEDNDDLRDAEESTMKSLEKQNKELMEIGTTFERRKTDNVFSELSRDFLVQKEMRQILRDIAQPKEMIEEELWFEPEEILENIVCLEKQHKELRVEQNAISNRSVDEEEFLQKNCNVLLENEHKSHPNAECIFAEQILELLAFKEDRKQAEILFDDKQILEESLEEKRDHHHPRDAFEESIKEVYQSTKERADSENGAVVFAADKKKNVAAAAHIKVCDWCNVMCTSEMDFDSHLRGKKHATTVKSLEFPPEETSKQKPCEVENVYERTKEVAAAERRRMRTSQVNLDSHLKGKKHVAVVKKQTGMKSYIYVKKNGP